MIKKLCTWMMKKESSYLLLILYMVIVILCAIISDFDKETSNMINIALIPIISGLLMNVIVKEIENGKYNIELTLYEKIDNTIIWREIEEEIFKDPSYICISNVGDIDIRERYI